MVGARARGVAGFCAAVAAGVGAAVVGKSPLTVASAAGASGAFVGFVPGWLEWLSERSKRREDLAELSGPAVVSSVTALLRADRGIVPFLGREPELADLVEWCQNPFAAPVRLVAGRGGVGKTRLAEELMFRLEKSWYCTAVGAGKEATAWDVTQASTNRRTLLVVDYAETRPGLVALLRSVAGAPDPSQVRVLLLARSAGEWWEKLGTQDAPVRSQVEAAKTVFLETDLGIGVTDDWLIAEAVRHFSRELGLDPVRTVSVAVPETTGAAPILVLHAAALVAVLRELGQLPSEPAEGYSVGDVLRSLLGHEQRFWVGSLPVSLASITLRACRAIVASGYLFSPFSLSAAENVLARVPELAEAGVTTRRDAAEWLRGLYPPSDQNWWGSLAPDMVAEHLVCEVLDQDSELAGGLLSRLGSGEAVRVLTVLARAGAHQAVATTLLEEALRGDMTLLYPALDVAIQTGGVLGEVIARVLNDSPLSQDALVDVLDAILYPSTALAASELVGAGLAATKRIVAQLPPDCDPLERARWLGALGSMFAQAGHPEEALVHTQQAVAIRRRSAQTEYRSGGDLATALDDLGVRLSEVGRPAEALGPAREAVAGFRVLSGADPDRYLGDLARSLDNLGIWYSQLGRPQEALRQTLEAVDIRNGLAASDPRRFRGDQARSLLNLGVRYSQFGRSQDALQPSRQAVELYRLAVAVEPERYTGELAQAYVNLADRLTELGRETEARIALNEAESLRLKRFSRMPIVGI